MTLDQFKAKMQELDRSPVTIRLYSAVIQRFMREMGKRVQYTSEEVNRFLDSLGSTTPEYKRYCYRVLKSFFSLSGWEWKVNYPKLPKGYEPFQPDLTPEQAKAMLYLAKQDCLKFPILINKRNLAILYILIDTGLRRAEVSLLNRSEYNPPELLIHLVKTGGVRVVILAPETIEALNNYLEDRQDNNPALFLGWKERINPQTVGTVFKHYANLLKLPKGVSCHSARRGLATGLYEAGMKDREIMELIGWRDPTMLQHYIKLKPHKVAAIARKLHPVFSESK